MCEERMATRGLAAVRRSASPNGGQSAGNVAGMDTGLLGSQLGGPSRLVLGSMPMERPWNQSFGRRRHYSKRVLCLGSRPYILPIPGRERSGVYRFRNFDDVEQMLVLSMRSRRVVVIGGGLLGLEAALGIALRNVDTVVVEHETHLMARQLDHTAGVMLEEQIMSMGIDIRIGRAAWLPEFRSLEWVLHERNASESENGCWLPNRRRKSDRRERRFG